jgi:hypothetical protein
MSPLRDWLLNCSAKVWKKNETNQIFYELFLSSFFKVVSHAGGTTPICV